MVLTEVYRNVDDIPNIGSYHIETAMVKSDDLMKNILRVKTDHGNEYGIRLDNEDQILENGSAFKLGDKQLLVLSVIADEMIEITPRDIDEMGLVAHFLGNLHKPVQIKDGKISLLLDKVVIKMLDKHDINYELKKVQLDQPLEYLDLTK
ncbi:MULTISPECIES: urease accessory protein UreE [Limosilactobacillus]|jgi:Urease accessory protein UreE|uniref:Urease accessory protein UreE n=4 Tax=Limosilactobacillus TaxID=2742598 RepID=A0A079YTX0_LIMRT|nr:MULTISPECIES: urease accessory protein UreE [Limosilactobacillus]MCW3763568.1 urease accessory protein UreE [Weissella confusa]GFI60707.1 urease accessory protein UreE [Lactobacillaceae bacterium]AGR65369.1 urease accessory protein UreE [Limosilactobacillus reuteri TD1]AXX74644.1 urease accessory protein UreE [Limosilactobacillus reuteri]EDX42992.1 UreE urease accessory domain protein [Limosilactobacillus reuteri subsp. rodentium]